MQLLEVMLVALGGIWQGIRQDFNLLELVLIAVAGLAWKRGWRPRWIRLPSIRRPWLAAIAIATAAISIRLALLPIIPGPIPVVSDEFSHLLLADTLSHGRVTNPPHPFWEHFESLHILQQPKYVSNYFPGHAAILALGRLLFATPWAGLLLECFTFLVVLFWMLRGWMPPRWALFGVLVAALRFGIGSYWVNAFHGGFMAAIGGALVLGAYPRLKKMVSIQAGIVLGTGFGILMMSRPFEGALFCLPPVIMLAWSLRQRVSSLAKLAFAAGVVVIATAGVLGAYFKEITGSPFVTAYQISQKTYGWPMALAWSAPPKIEHRHVELRNYYEYEIGEHEKVSGPVEFVEFLTFRLQEYWRFFLGPVLSIPLIMLERVWRRRKVLLLALAGGMAAILTEGASSPHYLAPATAAFIAIVVECARHLHAARIGIPRLLPMVMALILTLRIAAQACGLPYTQNLNYQSWCCEVTGNLNKDRITRMLLSTPGQHLVIVMPKTDPYNLLQWIYNDADIDSARIVWARDLGPEKNAALIKYFHGRTVWTVDPNVEPASLVGQAASLRGAASPARP